MKPGSASVTQLLTSTFVPVPSELVIPPAAFIAATLAVTDPLHMNVFVIVLMGTLGSMLGASINYFLAQYLGRPFILRYGKYVLCPPHKFAKMEKFFLTHGEFGTFTGRLVLGIRHFISFPAGLARMHLGKFLFYTALGSGIWCSVLAWIGWKIGQISKNMSKEQLQDLFAKNGKQAGLIAAAVCILLIVAYVIWHRRRTKKAASAPK